MKANNPDLSGLIKFLIVMTGRHLKEVMGDHFCPVTDEFDLDHEEII